MNLTLPIYVEEQRPKGAPGPIFIVRPLFRPAPERRAPKSTRALNLLAGDLRKTLTTLARDADHRALAEWTFAPDTEDHLLDLRIETKRGTANLRLLFVLCRLFDRRVAFTPSLPDLWFELPEGQDLATHATAILTRTLRDREKTTPDSGPHETLGIVGRAWITTLDLAIAIPTTSQRKSANPFAALADDEPVSGEDELERVGRCLGRLYPDDLDRAVGRDRELDELTRLLRASDRRPILLVGPHQVGKTTLIHEFVFRQAAQTPGNSGGFSRLWLLAPQRLLSGMSYVGQWEKRLLAILDHAAQRDLILYFDDLPGLCLAGSHSQSTLNMAQVLKSHLDRRTVRVLAEITPEGFRALKERNRGFADLFHILPLREPSESETLRILLDVRRRLEQRHDCAFTLDALPAAIELQRHYAQHLANPGRTAGFLRDLAAKSQHATLARNQVLDEFSNRTGLPREFLDPDQGLTRSHIFTRLAENLVGQRDAIEAAADLLVTACARLNDPNRPLGSLLFLGPTGVGKTECAKALARFLFGTADRLVRFDLNEFSSPAAAARLVGTFDQPEGLLTAAVRRQPFCVLLLDEVEKAHPDVLDILLAVLGEGRLTDALGRTATFANALIILTSNLGAAESRHSLGFQPNSRNDHALYLDAARKFFRPEFFNRIDRIVPFHPLDRNHLEVIARHLIAAVLAREGLRRYTCVLRLQPRAAAQLVEFGHHPQLGARALKRAVEQHLAQPVAARLAATVPTSPCLITLVARNNILEVESQDLETARPQPQTVSSASLDSPADLLTAILRTLHDIQTGLQHQAPDGPIVAGDISTPQRRYFALTEECRRLEARAHALLEQAEQPQHGPTPRASGRGGSKLRNRRGYDITLDPRIARATSSFDAAIRDLTATPNPEDPNPAASLPLLLGEVAWLNLVTQAPSTDQRALFVVRIPEGVRATLELLNCATSAGVPSQMHAALFSQFPGIDCNVLQTPTDSPNNPAFGPDRIVALEITGPAALDLARLETGSWLISHCGPTTSPGADEATDLLQTWALSLDPTDSPQSALDRLAHACRDWQDHLARAETPFANDPLPLLPLLRRTRLTSPFSDIGETTDFRSNLTLPRWPRTPDLYLLLLSQLPLPPFDL